MKTAPLFETMRHWRHDFHRHPEVGFAEHRTSARVAALLTSFGLEVHTGIGGTGVVGMLQKGKGARSIGLRADMDALPLTEVNGFDHCSQTAGTMHACGHDGHTAMLLGAAKVLADSGEFDGRVVFIFQPAEEHGQGALAMMGDGLFDRFPVDAVYGLHNMPGLPVGHVGARPGAIMASEALFEIHIQGQGGHAAMPHKGVDAITVGAQMVSALQTIVSRKLDPGLNGVVSVTEFITDGSRNVLPGHAVLKGDARALSPSINERIEEKMRHIVAGLATAHEVEAEVSYDTVFEVTQNASAPMAALLACASALLGSHRVDANYPPVLGSEDFAQMARAVPGCFFFMGNGSEGSCGQPLHATDYDFNDEGLVPGSSLWVALVEQALSISG
ncbi:MAG: amidohydrolase [Pseudomonadota bacterium]